MLVLIRGFLLYLWTLLLGKVLNSVKPHFLIMRFLIFVFLFSLRNPKKFRTFEPFKFSNARFFYPYEQRKKFRTRPSFVRKRCKICNAKTLGFLRLYCMFGNYQPMEHSITAKQQSFPFGPSVCPVCKLSYCLTKISIRAKRSISRVFSLFIVPSPFFCTLPVQRPY